MRVMLFLTLMVAAAAPALACSGLGAIHGSVHDSETTAPVVNAVVIVSSPICTQTVQTDERGNFSVAGLPFGIYSIATTKSGYEKTSFDVRIAGDRVAANVAIILRQRTIKYIRLTEWPALLNPAETSDVYSPIWSYGFLNITGSAFQFLPFVPGITFGFAPRMRL